MKNDGDTLAQALAALPVPALSPALRVRALVRARGQLVEKAQPRSFVRRLPAYATSAALLSADAVFLADACIKMGRAFGG